MPRQVECIIPVLPVSDLQRSLDFYTKMLGFTVDWGGGPGSQISSVSRDGRSIMLSSCGMGSGPTWVWIGVESDSVFEEFRRQGVPVRQAPQNQRWAYEMKFEDPDGNVLWLGTETKPDLPVEQ